MKQKIRPSVVMVTFPTTIKTVIPYIHIFMVITVEDCQNSFMPHLQKVEILRLCKMISFNFKDFLMTSSNQTLYINF